MVALYNTLAMLLGTAAIFSLLPYALRLVGRALGSNIRSRTRQRRELLRSRAKTEEAEQKKTLSESEGASDRENPKAASIPSSSDDEWEKVNEGGRTPGDLGTGSLQAGESGFEGVVGFFHPFCNAGGGGERLLFAAILATQRRYPNALCVVYTGDHDASKDQILNNVRNRFNIDLNAARTCFLYLSTREYVLASKWPHFTLLGQSIGSLILGWDAVNLLVPDILIDTMGYAFVLALSKWLFPNLPTGAYVHYPTISTDMLSSLHTEVSSGQGLNAGLGKGTKGRAKQVYWELFAKLYSWVGGSVDVVMTNSSWTQNHISRLWAPARKKRGKKNAISVVYPPCAVEELTAKIPVDAESEKTRTRNLLYIAQFRPEKMHHVIIDAFSAFLKSYKYLTRDGPTPKLILVGSVRDDHDEKRVYKLRLQTQEIKDHVQFVVNAKWPQILDFLKSSSVGVNGMWNEHFGIGVVEYQAAGLISVVNDSGGPKADIVVEIDGKPTGFRATTPEQFAAGFAEALSLPADEAFAMRQRARKSSWRFSEQVFNDAWTSHLEILVDLASPQLKRGR
ncbi:asparagine-linked glycosylation protein [Friedmanniomyces endolithicus]|uniref:GDP-Man:Man(3)GlcNAc(2)-PP-Dol alpha-1,2-mannosyltransferase n=1 Tax=Friedmanniomyces endolithicus TaxID=329885 RepID=A0AAN6KEQ4_9PEZI|nr:asparagine-linked glycosylation protein [Friedmanniomyces endolithicus]KAK0787336.1 asparagine-linked glycosylation protein [Friedmanniomyces endolithicus]KAK0814385.1 asparagine-linked glycosylation protein [Friedmanniomyces endolithicus]KAK0853659.1 asparagine-linked glycosylation protein [Friedmanniomyces endolithicus]KAK0912669.1 asparagine-linked glycosylation protein [Friedmanniomyces endolithicus]